MPSTTPTVATSRASATVRMPAARSSLAAEPEHLDAGSRGAQRAQQVRAVQVARRLAGDQQDTARREETRSACGRFAGVAHPTRAACAARTSVSTLSRITCGDLERAQPVPAGDRRRLPRAHGLHERVDLVLERIALARPPGPRTISDGWPVVVGLAAAARDPGARRSRSRSRRRAGRCAACARA